MNLGKSHIVQWEGTRKIIIYLLRGILLTILNYYEASIHAQINYVTHLVKMLTVYYKILTEK
jgi:hypothetical protein